MQTHDLRIDLFCAITKPFLQFLLADFLYGTFKYLFESNLSFMQILVKSK